MLLQPSLKCYPWGKLGSNSLVAQLAISSGCDIDEQKPYAELWMGAHPSGPSIIISGTKNENPQVAPESLQDFISKNPDVLGSSIKSRFGSNTLPFLFKVLSVEKALSIQAHPNKELAVALHSKDPANYPDDNHKPEMALAVTPFEVLCGFRRLDEINNFISEVPEFRDIVGGSIIKSIDDLRQAYKRLMTADQNVIKQKIVDLVRRSSTEDVPKIELVNRLNSHFPGDVGIFNIYFLQHFTLQPGEALFLPANEPHAYLSGDCLECMANSDNVVRAGLTPKFKDVTTLVDMLTFEPGKDWLFQGVPSGTGRKIFRPPTHDFAVECIEGSETILVGSPNSCSILLILEGNSKINNLKLSSGSVLFLEADSEITLELLSHRIQLFRAFCPS